MRSNSTTHRIVATAAILGSTALGLLVSPATGSAVTTGTYNAHSENSTIVIDVEGVRSSNGSLRDCNVGVSWNGVPSLGSPVALNNLGNGRYVSPVVSDGTYLVSVACVDSDGLVVIGPAAGTSVVVDAGGWSQGPGLSIGF